MKKTIYVVEDEKAFNDLVAQYLQKENYIVKSFYTYESAFAHIDDEVNLWILDIMLDDKSGFDLLEYIKEKNPETPVIFMSARDKEFDRIIGLEKGSDDYITKPVSPKELVLRVNNIIKHVYKDSKEQVIVDGYVLDGIQRKVIDGSKDIDLTNKEFEMLMLFVKNKGVAFSREKILVSIWQENYYGSDRVVDDTLRRLRKKLPKLNIHTIYGFGYRLG